jgi:hypothetical protein
VCVSISLRVKNSLSRAPLPFLLLKGGNWGAGVRDFSGRQEVANVKRSAIGNNKSVRAKWPRVVVLQRLQWSLGGGGGRLSPSRPVEWHWILDHQGDT